MLKFVVAVIGLLATTVTSSQFATREWSADFSDWATAGAEGRPGFVVGGDAAAQVWSELKNGEGMELLIQYAEDETASFRVSSEQIAIAAAMMEACINESRRDPGE